MNFLDPRLPERFWSKCVPEPNTGCWLWTGTAMAKGYGQFKWGRGMRYAHRVSYSVLVGEIPSGLQIDHRVCKQPCCVNPAHLQPVDAATNVRRSTSPDATRRRHAAVTHCPKGHEYTPGNTILRLNGTGAATCRTCRTCERMRSLAYWRREKKGAA